MNYILNKHMASTMHSTSLSTCQIFVLFFPLWNRFFKFSSLVGCAFRRLLLDSDDDAGITNIPCFFFAQTNI